MVPKTPARRSVRGSDRLWKRAVVILALSTVALSLGCSSYRAGRLYEQGTASLDARDSGAAIDDLERAAALAPHASEIRNHLGLAYAQAGRMPDALWAFEHAVALDCDNAAAQQNLVWAEDRLAAAATAVAAEKP